MILPLVLVLWAAGLAAAVAAVAWWRVVGPGFVWLGGGVATLLAALGTLAGGGAAAALAVLLALGGTLAARRPPAGTVALGLAALAALAAGGRLGEPLPALTGALLLGGVTGELTLGHWYLVDPRLPRWALRRLAAAGGTGLALEVALWAARGALSGGGPGAATFQAAYGALALLTLALLVGVWLSLREPSYAGVMAATGLSYLATITTLGVVVLGRLLGTANLRLG